MRCLDLIDFFLLFIARYFLWNSIKTYVYACNYDTFERLKEKKEDKWSKLACVWCHDASIVWAVVVSIFSFRSTVCFFFLFLNISFSVEIELWSSVWWSCVRSALGGSRWKYCYSTGGQIRYINSFQNLFCTHNAFTNFACEFSIE